MTPYVPFVNIDNNKTLLLTYNNKEEADSVYQSLKKFAELKPYINSNPIEVILLKQYGDDLKIALVNKIEDYQNYEWFIYGELTHLTTTVFSNPLDNLPVPLWQHQS